jgi:Tfp pilus assembly protein PilE
MHQTLGEHYMERTAGNEADLAMKEEQAMRESLRRKRGFTPAIVVVVAVLGIVAFVSLPLGIAGEGKSIVQRVRTAKTPADQQAIAAVFEKEAQAAQQKAKEHSQLKDVYAAKPDMQPMVSHCDMLVKHYEEIATELTAMAELHKKMGEWEAWHGKGSDLDIRRQPIGYGRLHSPRAERKLRRGLRWPPSGRG